MSERHEAKLKSIDKLKLWSEETGIELNNEDILRHSVAFDAGYDACERHFKAKIEVVEVFRYKK